MIPVFSSRCLTRDVRNSLLNCNGGGKGSINAENYQRQMVAYITQQKCDKTNGLRIKYEDNMFYKLKSCTNADEPLFKFTEDFDGYQQVLNKTLLYNFKLMCTTTNGGGGGSQTKVMRDIDRFIETQVKLLNNEVYTNYIFINILDGNLVGKHINDYKRWYSGLNNDDLQNKLFIGDMVDFVKWYSLHFGIDETVESTLVEALFIC